MSMNTTSVVINPKAESGPIAVNKWAYTSSNIFK